ncbi:MAG: hypothetical protein RLZ97_276, partial [Verrucomicrobiota bacterium]
MKEIHFEDYQIGETRCSGGRTV